LVDNSEIKLLKGIERVAKAEAMAAGLEGDRAPTIAIKDDYTPSLYNNPQLTARLTSVLTKEFGAEKINVASPTMGGEDFARYGRTEDRIPIMLLWLGAVNQAAYDASLKPGGKPLPSLHSSEFAPDPDPTIATGVKAMTLSALDLFR